MLALYPEQMNIYADRGNMLFLQRRCEWRGIGFELAAAGPREGFDPGAHDLIYIGGGQDRDQAMVARDMVDTKREALASASSTTAVSCWPSAAATSCSATATRWATSKLPGLGLADLETVREDGPRLIGNVVDRGRPRRRPAHDRRLREPRRPHLPARRRAARARRPRPRQQRQRRPRGRPPPQHVRHLPARPAAAEERLARRPPDRPGPRPPRRAMPELEPLDDAFEAAAHDAAYAAAMRG